MDWIDSGTSMTGHLVSRPPSRWIPTVTRSTATTLCVGRRPTGLELRHVRLAPAADPPVARGCPRPRRGRWRSLRETACDPNEAPASTAGSSTDLSLGVTIAPIPARKAEDPRRRRAPGSEIGVDPSDAAQPGGFLPSVRGLGRRRTGDAVLSPVRSELGRDPRSPRRADPGQFGPAGSAVPGGRSAQRRLRRRRRPLESAARRVGIVGSSASAMVALRSGRRLRDVDSRPWFVDTTIGSSGLRVFDLSSDPVTEVDGSPFSTGLPPYGLLPLP